MKWEGVSLKQRENVKTSNMPGDQRAVNTLRNSMFQKIYDYYGWKWDFKGGSDDRVE